MEGEKKMYICKIDKFFIQVNILPGQFGDIETRKSELRKRMWMFVSSNLCDLFEQQEPNIFSNQWSVLCNTILAHSSLQSR